MSMLKTYIWNQKRRKNEKVAAKSTADSRALRPPVLSVVPGWAKAFTLIEIIIVIVILAIAATLAVPMLSTAADMEVRSAAQVVAADLEYAKSMSISRQQNYSVVFDLANNSYQIQDDSSNVIPHPGRPGSSFVVDFDDDSRTENTTITAADFDSQQTITFDYLGSPFSSVGTANPLNNGTVTLQAGSFSFDIVIEPVTGYITIQ